jgi:anti-sigma B factor antagonist
MALLDVTTDERDGKAHLTLSGELDISTAPHLEGSLDRLSTAWPGVVIIDLRSLSFLDSTGLRLILRAHSQAGENGGRLMLVRGPAVVHRVFEMTRLEDELEFVDDPSTVA